MVSHKNENSDFGPKYPEIYSPETLARFADTGLNISPADVRELQDAMDDTAGQALYAGGVYGDVMSDLAGAVKRDEAKYVDKKRAEYERYLRGPSYSASSEYVDEKIAESRNLNDAYVWHYAEEDGGSFDRSVLWVARSLKETLKGEELYSALKVVKKTSDFIHCPDITYSEILLKLHKNLSKSQFKRLMNELETQDVVDYSLVYVLSELSEEIAQNFELSEAVRAVGVLKGKVWLLDGRSFFKSSASACQRFFDLFKDEPYYTRDDIFRWMVLCDGDINKLEAALPKFKKIISIGIDRASQNELISELMGKPDFYERFMLATDITEAFNKSEGRYNLKQLLNRKKSELEVLNKWLENKELFGEKSPLNQSEVYFQLSNFTGVIDEVFMTSYFTKLKNALGMLIEAAGGRWNRDTLISLVSHRLLYFESSQLDLLTKSYGETLLPAKVDSYELENFLRVRLLWEVEKSELDRILAALAIVPSEKIPAVLHALYSLDKLYKKDGDLLIQIVEILKRQTPSAIKYGSQYVYFTELYGEDIEEMDKVLTVLSQLPEHTWDSYFHTLVDLHELYEASIENLKLTVAILKEKFKPTENIQRDAMGKLKVLYGKNIQKMGEVLDVLNEVEEGNGSLINSLVELAPIYQTSIPKMREVLKILKEVPVKQQREVTEALLTIKVFYETDLEKLRATKDLLVKLQAEDKELSIKELCDKAATIPEILSNDLGKLELFGKYLGVTDVFDKKVLEKFIEIHEKEGFQSAANYVNSLRVKAKGLVGSSVPEGHRDMEEYQYLVRYVYPKGNYSDHEKNLACGDKLEHVAGYAFDRGGYPVLLSGLTGYGLKEGEKENPLLLSAYSTRLDKMRAFVSSRGPDSKLLQEAFDQKIEAAFKQKASADFQEFEGLSAKEKLFCLIVSEAVRKAKELGMGGSRTLRTDESKIFVPDEEILDLVVEYKYAYHEDLEAYVRRSADDVKQYEDSVSQNYILWSELSVIYGENMKHVMRNDIMEKIIEEPNFQRILDAYVKTIAEIAPEGDILNKARERIKATLDNTHIPDDKKPEVMWKQLWTLFASNLKFDTPEQSKLFETKLREAVKTFLATPSLEGLEQVLPKLLSIRNERRFDIGAKVEDLLSRDIGIIFKELAKYEELAEIEEKETSMNGPKNKVVKKSTKRRKIRGHITKTQESANARMGAYLCIAGDTKMWENPNYFEMVMEDEETNRCVGLAMMLRIDAVDGKKYIWFGPNPFESFMTQVSAKKTYDFMYKTVCNFAEENGFDGVVVPSNENSILGACTNRGGEFPGLIKASRVKDDSGNIKIVKFGAKHTLGGTYGYEDGALIWERKEALKAA